MRYEVVRSPRILLPFLLYLILPEGDGPRMEDVLMSTFRKEQNFVLTCRLHISNMIIGLSPERTDL